VRPRDVERAGAHQLMRQRRRGTLNRDARHGP
jgi:hypothetical protein